MLSRSVSVFDWRDTTDEDMTLRENMQFLGLLRGLQPAEVEDRIRLSLRKHADLTNDTQQVLWLADLCRKQDERGWSVLGFMMAEAV